MRSREGRQEKGAGGSVGRRRGRKQEQADFLRVRSRGGRKEKGAGGSVGRRRGRKEEKDERSRRSFYV